MSWGTQLPSYWDEYRPTKVNDKYNAMMKVMQVINIDCKRSNNTSKEIEIKRQAIVNTKNLFRSLNHHSMFLPSPQWRILLFTKGSSQRDLTTRNYKRSTQDWSTQLHHSVLYTRGRTKPIELIKLLVITLDHKHSLIQHTIE